MSEKKLLLVDCLNLSCSPVEEVRTGIQEAEYQILQALIRLREEFLRIYPQWDILPLLDAPKILRSTDRTPRFILKRLNQVSAGWIDEVLTQTPEELLARASKFHAVGLINVARTKQCNPTLKVSATLHDLGPVTFPDYCPPGMEKWFRVEYLPGLEVCDLVIGDSEYTARHFAETEWGRRVRKIGFLPLATYVDRSAVRDLRPLERFGLKPKEYFLYLGSLEPRKNVGGMIQGYRCFREKFPESQAPMVWAGKTGWNNLLFDTSSWIKTGYLADHDIYSLIGNSAALVMISVLEGFGIPISQARALGTQVVTHWGSSLPEVAGRNAIFVDPGSASSIADGMNTALRSKVPPAASEDWTWDDYVRELVVTLLGQ